MKKKITSALIFTFAITMSFAQDTMYVRQKLGRLLKYPISNVDSVFFKNPNDAATIDGYTYPIVKIGTQTWMAENLRTTKYNNGTPIPLITNTTAPSTPAMFWNKNDSISSQTNKYGALYNWYAINAGEICPKGWHVPSNDEWTTMINYLGTNPGLQLKSTTGWNMYFNASGNGTNSSGFNALPAPTRTANGTFGSIGTSTGWWTSTESSKTSVSPPYAKTSAFGQGLSYTNSAVTDFENIKENGNAIRCIRD
ncbi:MAG TPA: hypothetical protein DCR46_05235 [Cytophagales bacterium]|jgi:uncharacterized protein (TIGR02145 family)|nr:hypothetical protein [Cytophagales bacterium]